MRRFSKRRVARHQALRNERPKREQSSTHDKANVYATPHNTNATLPENRREQGRHNTVATATVNRDLKVFIIVWFNWFWWARRI